MKILGWDGNGKDKGWWRVKPKGMLRVSERWAAWRDDLPGSRKLFVIGTGRAGTHLIGYILNSHPLIYTTLEPKLLFQAVTAAAIDPRRRPFLVPLIVWTYRLLHVRAAPLSYADKSHPNIWLAESLSQFFPGARFIGTQRNPYGTIASMLSHEGVLNWFRQWKRYPLPNEFLGIDRATAETYDSLPLVAKCALRWNSHRRRLDNLQRILGSKLYTVQYERLVGSPIEEVERLQRFLELRQPFPSPDVRRAPLSKWKSQLSQTQIEIIEEVTGVTPNHLL